MTQVATLSYAEPTLTAGMPPRWLRRAMWVWAMAVIVQTAGIWGITLWVRWGTPEGLVYWGEVPQLVTPIASVVVIAGLLRRKSQRSVPLWFSAPCAAVVCGWIFMTSQISASDLRTVHSYLGTTGTIAAFAHVFLTQLLTIAWPVAVVIFAARGLPTARAAAAGLMWWATGVSVFSMINLGLFVWKDGFRRALVASTIAMPFIVAAALVISILALILWRRSMSQAAKRLLFALIAGSWFGVSMFYYRHSGLFFSAQQWNPPDLGQINELFRITTDVFVLRQITPIMLALVATFVDDAE